MKFRILAAMLVAASSMLLSGQAAAKVCELSIEGTDQMTFSKKAMTVTSDCTKVKVKLTHVGKLPKAAMGHNWVLTTKENMQAVVSAGLKAGLNAGYLPKNDDRVIAHTKLLGGGESDTVTFSLKGLSADEEYKFFCSFPGHSAVMQGAFKIKPAGKKS